MKKELVGDDAAQPKETQSAYAPELINALVISGEGDLVDKLISRNSKIDIDYFTHRLQHDKVFKKFGLDPTLENFDETFLNEWITELPGKLNPNGPLAIGASGSFENYVEFTRFLVHMGYPDQAQKLYRTIIDSISRCVWS